MPFVVIPVALGSAVTLLLVNVFPARRARDILMLMGLVFAMSIVLLLRVPAAGAAAARRVDAGGHRLLRHAAVAGHAAAAVVLGGRGAVRGAAGRPRLAAHGGAVDDGARPWSSWSAAAFERWHFAGFSKAQEARKARFTQWRVLDRLAGLLPLSPVRRHLLVKDLKVFLRDVSQWSQLLLLLALVLVYLYNFRVLDLERIPYMSGVLKNAYAFLNLGDGRLRDGDRDGALRVPGGVGGGRGVLDHPHRADLAAGLPVVEVLDRAGAGAGADRDA